MHLEKILGLLNEENFSDMTMKRESENFTFSGTSLGSISGEWNSSQVENSALSPLMLSPKTEEINEWDQISSIFQYPTDPYYSETGNLYSPGSTGSEVSTPTWGSGYHKSEYGEFSDEVLRNQRLPPVETVFSFSRPFGSQVSDFSNSQVIFSNIYQYLLIFIHKKNLLIIFTSRIKYLFTKKIINNIYQ